MPKSHISPLPPTSPTYHDEWAIAAFDRHLKRIHDKLDWEAQHGPVKIVYTAPPSNRKDSAK